MTPGLIPGQLLLERALKTKRKALLAYIYGPPFFHTGFNLIGSTEM